MQRATLARMEPMRAAAALAPMRERLERLGLDPDLVDAPLEPQAGLPETDEDRRERLALQAANKAARWRTRLPAMYLDASLVDLDETQHCHDLTRWLDSDRRGLILAGSVGTGKTHAAYAVANAAVARGLVVEAWTTHDLLSALRPDGDPTALRYAREADVLVLDDLAVSKVSDWAQEALTSLLDARLREGRRLVLTTNAPSTALGEAWGQRALDRMMARAATLVFTGPSRRAAGW